MREGERESREFFFEKNTGRCCHVDDFALVRHCLYLTSETVVADNDYRDSVFIENGFKHGSTATVRNTTAPTIILDQKTWRQMIRVL